MSWALTGRGRARVNCLPAISGKPPLSEKERLAIYGDGYFLRLVGCMGENFESTRNVIGPHAFGHLARAYLMKHPSTFRCIDNVGHLFPTFLKKQPIAKKIRFLPELAAFEWGYNESFYAPDEPAEPIEMIYSGDSRFRLGESVKLFKSGWDIVSLWKADGDLGTKRVKKKTSFAVIYRRADKVVQVMKLKFPEYTLLSRLKSGQPLQDALRIKASPQQVRKWFEFWTAQQIIKLRRVI